jgi:hypothetical protein
MVRADLGPDFKSNVQVALTAWVSALPDEPGLYVVTLDRLFPRLRSETDILYIGQAGKPVNGAPATIRRRWASRWGFPTYNEVDLRHVMRSLLSSGEQLSVLCACPIPILDVLLRREAELLDRFFQDHLELPPLNRAKPAKK